MPLVLQKGQRVKVTASGEEGKIVFLGGGYYHIVEMFNGDQHEFGLHEIELVVLENNYGTEEIWPAR